MTKVKETTTVVDYPPYKVPKIIKPVQGFADFVREQGVVGLAVGLVLGTAIKEVVDTLVKAFIDPLVGLLVPNADSLATATFTIQDSTFQWGLFVSVLIRFVSIAAVIYFAVHGLKLDKIDRKKPE